MLTLFSQAALLACLAGVPSSELAASLAGMKKQLAVASALATKGAHLGGNSFFAQEIALVDAEVARLEQEQTLVKRCKTAAKASQIKVPWAP